MEHLHPSVRPYLLLPDPERIRKINSARWIGYTRANAILARMAALLDHARVPRMPSLLIVAGTNQGKTTLLHKFYADHAPVDKPSAEHVEMPVVIVLNPPEPDEKRFYGSVLTALGFPYPATSNAEGRLHQIQTIMKRVGCRMLILDELHNTLAGSGTRRLKFLNALRDFSTLLQLSIVGAGTSDALDAVALEPQLKSRLLPVFLPEWNDNKEFWRLLTSFERLLPLKKPSDLKGELIAEEILTLSEGVLGEASAILTQAASKAVSTGEEQITLKLIRSLGFVRPSARNKIRESDHGDGGVLDFQPDLPEDRKLPSDALAA